MQRKERWG